MHSMPYGQTLLSRLSSEVPSSSEGNQNSLMKDPETGIESTYNTFPRTLTPMELLVDGAASREARLLQHQGISLTRKRKRNEVIADIILGVTGQLRTRKMVSHRLQGLKRVLRAPVQAYSSNARDWISDIVSYTQFEQYAMHDAIFQSLHNRVLEVANEISTLKSVAFNALGPAFRSAIHRILLSALAEDLTYLTEIFHNDSFPGLRSLTIRIYDQYGPGHLPLSREAKETFIRAFKAANPEAEVKLFMDKRTAVRSPLMCAVEAHMMKWFRSSSSGDRGPRLFLRCLLWRLTARMRNRVCERMWQYFYGFGGSRRRRKVVR